MTVLNHYSPITLPGTHGSDDDHWQSRWERDHPTFRRFRPTSWDHPELSDWSDALSTAVQESRLPVLLVAHSLATLLVAHWAAAPETPVERVAGALLVSVPDPEGLSFPSEAPTFCSPPRQPLPFASRMVVSSTDPYSTVPYARATARAWAAELVELGALGHITSGTVPAPWPEGLELLRGLVAGLDSTAGRQTSPGLTTHEGGPA